MNDSIFGYTGQKYDAEFALYSYKARYYSPQIGRFLQPDPIGYLAGDLNLYSYVSNDPLNHTDPSGQYAITDVWTPVLQFIVDVIRDVVVTAPPPVNGGGTGPGDKPAIASPGVAGTPVNGPGSQPGVVYATGPGEGSGTGPSDSSEPEQPQPPEDPEPAPPRPSPDQQKPDAYHNWPEDVYNDVWSRRGEGTSWTRGGYTQYNVPGSYMGSEGTFQLGVEDGRATHTFFSPN